MSNFCNSSEEKYYITPNKKINFYIFFNKSEQKKIKHFFDKKIKCTRQCKKKGCNQVNKSCNQKIDMGKSDKIEYNCIAKLNRTAEILLNQLNLLK